MFKDLDEEARVPKGSSITWYQKLKKKGTAKQLPNVEFPASKDVFNVRHYAGVVTYNPIAFLEKNVETLNNDLVQVLQASTVPLIRALYTVEPAAGGSSSEQQQQQPASRGRSSSQKAGGGAGGGGGGSGASKSIAWNFQNQLTSLMTMLRSTEGHFVRCVKSNAGCKAMVMEPGLVQKQLLYSGVFEGK